MQILSACERMKMAMLLKNFGNVHAGRGFKYMDLNSYRTGPFSLLKESRTSAGCRCAEWMQDGC